jgi:PAS domain S-box-containing protein
METKKGFLLATRYPWSIQETSAEAKEKLRVATEKISKLEELQQQLQEMSLVADRTSSGVVVSDANGLITWVNEGFTKMTGYSQEDVRGKRRLELSDKQPTDTEEAGQFQAGIESRKSFSVELSNIKKNGARHWIHMDVTPIFEAGTLTKYISIESDVTPLHETQEQLEKANKQLQESNDYMVGRELKMAELKKEIARLKEYHA